MPNSSSGCQKTEAGHKFHVTGQYKFHVAGGQTESLLRYMVPNVSAKVICDMYYDLLPLDCNLC